MIGFTWCHTEIKCVSVFRRVEYVFLGYCVLCFWEWWLIALCLLLVLSSQKFIITGKTKERTLSLVWITAGPSVFTFSGALVFSLLGLR